MTEQLHRLIDSGGEQNVINERVAGLIEKAKGDLDRIGTDHEKRIRYLERALGWALGFVGCVSTILYLISTLKR